MAANFKMANLARNKESLKPKNIGKIAPDPYSYEHRITLDQDTLDKLGMDIPKVGQKFHVMGHAEVRSVSQNDHGEGDRSTRVELQMKKMALKPKKGTTNSLFGAVNTGINQANEDS